MAGPATDRSAGPWSVALGGGVLLVSTPLLLEYETVLTRPEHLTACGASAEDTAMVLDDVVAISDWVSLDYLWRPQLRDADDEMVLETAANGGADALVTFNLADLAGAAVRFGICAGAKWRVRKASR